MVSEEMGPGKLCVQEFEVDWNRNSIGGAGAGARVGVDLDGRMDWCMDGWTVLCLL